MNCSTHELTSASLCELEYNKRAKVTGGTERADLQRAKQLTEGSEKAEDVADSYEEYEALQRAIAESLLTAKGSPSTRVESPPLPRR